MKSIQAWILPGLNRIGNAGHAEFAAADMDDETRTSPQTGRVVHHGKVTGEIATRPLRIGNFIQSGKYFAPRCRTVKRKFCNIWNFLQYRKRMSPEQSRAARGWLAWSQSDLAQRAGVATNTVHGFESGQRTLTRNNLAALRRAIEEAGIQLVFDGAGLAAGILRKNADIGTSDNPVTCEQRS